MLREHYTAEFRAARRTRLGAMLAQTAVAATIGLACAVSGAAVALHLAAGLPTGEYLPRHRGAATPAAIAPAPMQKPLIAAEASPSAALANPAESAEVASTASVSSLASAAPRAALPPIPERELTFAWGYAQRHPGAGARQADARVLPALAGARAQATAMASTAERRRAAERQRAWAARREIVALAPAGGFGSFDRDQRQGLGYTEQQPANGLGVFGRPQPSPGRRHPTHSQP